jgi:hypothetical protein
MLFTDLLRMTVLLIGGEATALGGVGVLAASQQNDTATIVMAAVWWPIAMVVGLVLGRPQRAADGVREALASARTSVSLPEATPSRIALTRLWPLALFALIAGGLAWLWPQVCVIGAGYALLVALAWRHREAAVTGVEDRDGVRFYVEPSSAFEPVRLIRTPGLMRDRQPAGHPPPPPPVE